MASNSFPVPILKHTGSSSIKYNLYNHNHKTDSSSSSFSSLSSSHIPSTHMNLSLTKPTKTSWFFSILISFYILLSYTDITTSWSAFCPMILPVAGVFLTATLLIVVARATVMAWITVLVLLAFAGRRRRVLVQQGRKITTDIAMHLVKVVVKERGLVAVACAAVLSLMAMIQIEAE